jgi:Zn-dependent protease
MFFMSGWWVADYYRSGGAVVVVSWIFWVLFSITLHELAHGWAALWQGDDTPRRYRRMTMNPIVHMGPMSLLMFAIIGIAWGLMPVDPSRFRWKRKGRVVVAAAGPAMNILLALLSLTVAAVWLEYGPVREPLFSNVQHFLFIGGMLNLVLAVFNLLPFPPLDGSNILMGLSLRWYRLYQNPQAQMVGMFILLAVFVSGIGSLLFGAAASVGNRYVDAILTILPS